MLSHPVEVSGSLVVARKVISGNLETIQANQIMQKSELPTPLGPLERAVLEALWQYRDAVSVRELHPHFAERIAYTTLMTTLDRLYKKGILHRSKKGRAFLYTPRVTAREYQRGFTQRVLDQLIGRESDGVAPLLACIVDAVSDHDREWLDELDRLIQQKRRTLDRPDLDRPDLDRKEA